MPGAPNRPPATTPSGTPAPPGEEAGRAVLRRLAPARVALNLDLWKGAPAPDLIAPYDRAEKAYESGDWNGAQGALDQLAVRFAEPRWPTLPTPFRSLRVSIPAPQPPTWDPDHALPAPEKEAKRLKAEAEKQIALLRASVTWLKARNLPADDLEPVVSRLGEMFTAEGASAGLWSGLDEAWAAVRERAPVPRSGASRPPAPEPA
ncbi:MAG TPA: hypothetical protein VEY07_09315 [Thermoplasmata archaeon]|nr:hypothetical protein [Thermoplasmata archaeon]